MIVPSGEVVRASRDENADLFWGTFGGMGLLGVVLSARLRLRPRRSRVGNELLRQLLVEQREQQVLWIELRIAHAARELLRGGNGLL